MKKKTRINKKKKTTLIDEILQKRLLVILVFIIILFVVVFIKLYQVMIMDNYKYKKELEELSYDTVEGASAPRGRILDRNYNVIVDNTAVKTIYYKKSKKTTTKEEIDLAYNVSKHLNLDMSKLTPTAKKEFWILIHPVLANEKITKNAKST